MSISQKTISQKLTRRSALLLAGAGATTLALTGGAFAQSARTPEDTVDVDDLLQPGPLPEMVKGDEEAPVTVVEYASMTCGHCATFHNETWPQLEEEYVKTGKVRFIVREFPFDPRAAAAFMLARCAPNDAHFPMMDALFSQQRTWAFADNARTPLENIAKLAGFTQESFEACLTDQQLLNDVNAVKSRGETEFGVRSTPTFFVNGAKYSGAMTFEQFSAILDPLLAS
ncbi:MAG: DsbA family protein [Pseudomonadota bacterium]